MFVENKISDYVVRDVKVEGKLNFQKIFFLQKLIFAPMKSKCACCNHRVSRLYPLPEDWEKAILKPAFNGRRCCGKCRTNMCNQLKVGQEALWETLFFDSNSICWCSLLFPILVFLRMLLKVICTNMIIYSHMGFLTFLIGSPDWGEHRDTIVFPK